MIIKVGPINLKIHFSSKYRFQISKFDSFYAGFDSTIGFRIYIHLHLEFDPFGRNYGSLLQIIASYANLMLHISTFSYFLVSTKAFLHSHTTYFGDFSVLMFEN